VEKKFDGKKGMVGRKCRSGKNIYPCIRHKKIVFNAPFDHLKHIFPIIPFIPISPSTHQFPKNKIHPKTIVIHSYKPHTCCSINEF
jgi:hypothetical protein